MKVRHRFIYTYILHEQKLIDLSISGTNDQTSVQRLRCHTIRIRGDWNRQDTYYAWRQIVDGARDDT